MKAIVWTKYGPPESLQLQEVETPTPRENEVLIRVHASTVTAGDCELRQFQLPFLLQVPLRIYVGFRKPKRITILGQELAGEVEAVGRDVKQFKPGDPVFGSTGIRLGAYAEYICLPGKPGGMGGVLVMKPDILSYEQAAAVPVGGLEAWHFLKQAHLRPRQKVLILGAGGSIGTFAVQLARDAGAEVIAVDRLSKLDMLRSIGADHVMDYTSEDFTKSGEIYDVVFDVVGKSHFSRSLRSLKENGTYLVANAGPSRMIRRWAARAGSRKIIFGTSAHTPEDLIYLRQMLEAGRIKPVIDRIYPLEQTAEAHAYVDTGEKKGAVVIAVIPTQPLPNTP